MGTLKPVKLVSFYTGVDIQWTLLPGAAAAGTVTNHHAEYYSDKDLPSFPRDTVHPWQYNNKAYHSNIVSFRRVAAEVSAVDDSVGEVMDTLEKHGLDQNAYSGRNRPVIPEETGH